MIYKILSLRVPKKYKPTRYLVGIEKFKKKKNSHESDLFGRR